MVLPVGAVYLVGQSLDWFAGLADRIRHGRWDGGGVEARICDSKAWYLPESESQCAERPCLLVRMGVPVGSMDIKMSGFMV